jgi:hypothetical protein
VVSQSIVLESRCARVGRRGDLVVARSEDLSVVRTDEAGSEPVLLVRLARFEQALEAGDSCFEVCEPPLER